MNWRIIYRTAVLCSVSLLSVVTSSSPAQLAEKQAPRFTLTIAAGKENEDYTGDYSVMVTEKNVSNRPLRETVCVPFLLDPKIQIAASYNGVPMEMDETKSDVKLREKFEKGQATCPNDFEDEANAGGGAKVEFTDYLEISKLYDMSKAGKYEFTVSRNSDWEHPEEGVMVSSNKLAIVIPDARLRVPSWKAEIAVTPAEVRNNETIIVAISIRNTGALLQKLVVWTCSFQDQWITDTPAVHTIGMACQQNAPGKVRLQPGEVFTSKVPMHVELSAMHTARETVTFRMGYGSDAWFGAQKYPSRVPPLFWSNPITVTIAK